MIDLIFYYLPAWAWGAAFLAAFIALLIVLKMSNTKFLPSLWGSLLVLAGTIFLLKHFS